MGDRIQVGRIRKKSISRVFAKYIVYFSICFILTFIFIESAFFISINQGVLLPANYYEKIIDNNSKTIKEGKISDIDKILPKQISYIVYDKNFNILYQNTSDDITQKMISVAQTGSISKFTSHYKYIDRDDNTTAIFKYKLTVSFKSDILNNICPNVEILENIVIFALFIFYIILFSKRASKKISKEMTILKQTISKINSKNLDFKVKHSNISEIDAAIESLEMMKSELKDSLKREWDVKEEKNRQMGALIHDLKTPLTVIRGNSELMAEENLNEDQIDYNDSILSEVKNMENYIKILMDMVNSERNIEYNKENIDIESFTKEITDESLKLCRLKNIEFINSFQNLSDSKDIIGDRKRIQRAVFNVITNAVSYTPLSGKIMFNVIKNAEETLFIVEDSGEGFSKEDLINATKEFYTKDKSRQGLHYGMGLYIADIICRKHNGLIEISNCEKLGGARVSLKLKNS